MDIRQLYYYKEIIQQGSISKAADALHIAQPPLSQLLKKLEDELGSTLIHRYRKKWQVTETGTLLYDYANRLLNEMEDVKQRITEIENGESGTVHIGVSSSCSNLLLDYIKKHRLLYPNVKVHIHNGNSEELLLRLEQKEIDVAFLLRPIDHTRYDHILLKLQSCRAVIPAAWSDQFPDHEVTFKQLANPPFVMLAPLEGLSLTENIASAFHHHQVQPNVIIECKDIQMVIQLVNKEVGVSIIPIDYLTTPHDLITLKPIKGFDEVMEPAIIKLKDANRSVAAQQFWQMMTDTNEH
ncbi:LysR family transcriptional regulator [Bacillaceae bacterium JMAK1]|nr:LysR family transcriptional regulator [Bacillaceae bacterium JMAK1]